MCVCVCVCMWGSPFKDWHVCVHVGSPFKDGCVCMWGSPFKDGHVCVHVGVTIQRWVCVHVGVTIQRLAHVGVTIQRWATCMSVALLFKACEWATISVHALSKEGSVHHVMIVCPSPYSWTSFVRRALARVGVATPSSPAMPPTWSLQSCCTTYRGSFR